MLGWRRVLHLIALPVCSSYGELNRCRATVSCPTEPWSDGTSTVYQVFFTFPDWIQDGLVTVEFSDSTTGLADSGCWDVIAGQTDFQQGQLTFRLGAHQGANRRQSMGCTMQGVCVKAATHVSYVGSHCFVPPPPPPHLFADCALTHGASLHVIGRSEDGWTAEVNVDHWSAGSIMRLEFNGHAFNVDRSSLQHVSVHRTARTWTEFALGNHPTQPVILCSAAGTGKTWSAVQLAHELALRCRPAATTDDVPLVPAIIYAQRLARMLQERLEDAPLDSSILLQFFAREYGAADQAHGKWLTMLSQALQMRTLIVIIDGIDEAAGRRDAVSKLIREVLVPEG